MADIDLQRLTRLTSSGNKKDRIAGQRLLKGLGLYSGPLDGKVGGGSTKAIAKLRAQVQAKQKQQARLQEIKLNAAAETARINAATRKRKDAAEALRLKNLNDAKKKTKATNDAIAQVTFTGVALGTSVAFAAHEVKKLDAIDSVAVKAKNAELGKYSKEIDAIKRETGSRTKAKTLKAATKRRIGAVAAKANAQGVTKFKAPIGLSSGLLLAGKGALLQYAASQSKNEYVRDGLNATASGLYVAGLGVPAARFTRVKFGKNPLNGTHIAKLADAEAIGKTVKNTKAGKAAKDAASFAAKKTGLKTLNASAGKVAARVGATAIGRGALRFAGPIGLIITAGLTARASYNAYQKTGSFVKAAEAGADELTLGGYSLAKKYALNTPKKPVKTASVTKAQTRSLTRSLKSNTKTANKIKPVRVSSVRKVPSVSQKRFINVTNAKGTTFKRKNYYYGKTRAA